MKANELTSKDLMIGDWLMFNDNPCQVKALHIDDTAIFVEYRSAYYVLDAEPIPLTPEILEKNGFELDKVMTECCMYNGIDNRVILHNDKDYMNSDNEWDVHIDSEDYCTIANCELTYVHQLQQLLRLCKIYKEIVV